jgi:lipopolysaccharide/colanic/teichoic acid biosynthesis glycosyltransferase
MKKANMLDGLYSAKQILRILALETARADRNGHEFSFTVFKFGEKAVNTNGFLRLLPILRNRLRSTDVVGWFRPSQIGVVLPYTPSAGAEKLARDICKEISDRISPLEFEVYTYPSPWLSQDKDSHGQQTESLESFLVQPMPVWKRFMDIIGSLTGLILFAPVFVLIALLIKTISPGPVFFRQRRVGYLGKDFTIWKFRTMLINTDTSRHHKHVNELMKDDLTLRKLDDDPQIIPFGKILRKSCLDELPQLINVLLGDMSLVGPRPEPCYNADGYLVWHRARFNVVPGMTGLWQIKGKNKTTFSEMMRLDIAYARKRSFWLEIKILLLTVPAIMSQVKEALLTNQGKQRV